MQFHEISTQLLQWKDIFKDNMQMSVFGQMTIKLFLQNRWTLATSESRSWLR